MGDVLSQEEIDRLLRAYSDGELDAENMKEEPDVRVVDYDFRRPSKFSKEHPRWPKVFLVLLFHARCPYTARNLCACKP